LIKEEDRGIVFFNLPDPVIIIDGEKGKILSLNPSFCRAMGYEKEDLVDRNFSVLLSFPPEGFLENMMETIREKGTFSENLKILCGDGQVRVMNMTAALAEINSLMIFIASFKDVADYKEKEEKLQKYNQNLELLLRERSFELKKLNEELKREKARSAKLKEEFLASMSHELKTPLNSILGMSDVLLEQHWGPLNDMQLKYLKIIDDSGRHLLNLINDILDLSRIEAKKINLIIDKVDVKNLYLESLALIRDAAQKKGITVNSVFDDRVINVYGDKKRLRQILFNLLSNAVKFTPEGGEVGLEVKGYPDEEKLDFTVWDRGIGITKENMRLLFRPFLQLDGSLSRKYSGTGLGLILVERLTELLGGGISLESESGKGSRFTVAFPWKNNNDDRPLILKESGIKILIIDDTPESACFLADYLEEMKIKTFIHTTGDGAMDKVLEIFPDLIIMDIILPGFSGWDVLLALKKEDITRDIPVIITSVIGEHLRGISSWASAYLVKPVSLKDFQMTLEKFLPAIKEKFDEIENYKMMNRKKPLILLADDNEEVLCKFSDYLEIKGYNIITARNGSEAIERVRKNSPDLILMDIQMPGIDGLEAIRYIREELEMATIPVIALSSLVLPGDKERSLEGGADEFMGKPVGMKKLLPAVERFLKEKMVIMEKGESL